MAVLTKDAVELMTIEGNFISREMILSIGTQLQLKRAVSITSC